MTSFPTRTNEFDRQFNVPFNLLANEKLVVEQDEVDKKWVPIGKEPEARVRMYHQTYSNQYHRGGWVPRHFVASFHEVNGNKAAANAFVAECARLTKEASGE